MNRREALTRLGGFMALGLFGGKTFGQTTATESLTSATAAAIPAGKPFTIAHITDVHITPHRDAQAWFAKCLHTIQSHSSKPGFILNTGDSVMETLNVDRAEADKLWKIWRDTIQNDNSLPIHHVMGNHDHWGLARSKKDATILQDPLYGKKRGLDGLGMPKSYYSFDQGGWHFIGLDSVLPFEEAQSGWTGGLDDEQFHWLQQDLRATPADRPVFVYSHIPILQVASFKSLKPNEKNAYSLNPGIMLGDARRVIDLFERHPNVKVCVSGHLHLQDRVELSGVTYICAGAVSGAWWKGTHVDSAPGYSLFHLNPDGTFAHSYETYGWAGKPEDAKS